MEYRLLCTRSNVSLHTTCCPSQSDYLSKAFTYVRDFLHVGTAKRTLCSWPQTASIELCAAWISQANVQLGCARTNLDRHPPQELRPLLENFIAVLLKALKAFKDIIQDNLKDPPNCKGKAKVEDPKPGISYRELSAAAQVLWIGEEFIACAQNLYKGLLK